MASFVSVLMKQNRVGAGQGEGVAFLFGRPERGCELVDELVPASRLTRWNRRAAAELTGRGPSVGAVQLCEFSSGASTLRSCLDLDNAEPTGRFDPVLPAVLRVGVNHRGEPFRIGEVIEQHETRNLRCPARRQHAPNTRRQSLGTA